MAVAACGCKIEPESDGSWVVAEAEAACPFAHRAGLRGWVEGEPSRVTGVGSCMTIVFERASRTAMLATPSETPGSTT